MLLAAAGGLAVGTADLTTPQVVKAVAVFTVIASSTVTLPWLLYAVLGDRMLAPLSRARDWLKAHNATVVALVLAALGVLLVIDGLSGL